MAKKNSHYISIKESRAILKYNIKQMKYYEAQKMKKRDESEYTVPMKDPNNLIEIENLKTVSKIQGDFHFENIICNQEGCTFDFYNGKEKIQLKSKLIGNFVPENIALAVSCACLLEVSTRNIQEGILECEYIEGRMA